jgi:hypothetical protein
MGKTSAALERALAADAPTRLPPAPIASIGANLHIRLAEMRAGKEL